MGFGSSIRSIQEGTVTILVNETVGTAPITSINEDKTMLVFLGVVANSSSETESLCRIEITDDDEVTATRNTSDAALTGVAHFMVVEYY